MISTKCFFCNKKIGLLGFECRCEHLFCSKHRFPTDHNCLFDFKKRDKEILKKSLDTTISFQKIEKI